ncbi:hypothetical protein L0F63_000247 [Massospora cicadina]|nr:hypothetical protein L0F63_000247 [Massospora cicadina]
MSLSISKQYIQVFLAYGYQPEGCGFNSRPSHIDRGASRRKLLAHSIFHPPRRYS